MNKKESDLRRKTILILDDSEVTRLALKVAYELAGATVYSAGHIKKGITALEGLMSSAATEPCIILADICLPGAYGFDALRSIADTVGAKKCPILLMSRGLSKYALNRASLYGVAGYVEKPVPLDKIFDFSLEIIEAFEEKKRALKNQQLIPGSLNRQKVA